MAKTLEKFIEKSNEQHAEKKETPQEEPKEEPTEEAPKEDTVEEDVPVASASPKFVLESKGRWHNVVNAETGKRLNDKALNKEEAEQLLSEAIA